ncbi:MAG: hypothetical protein Q9175_005650 [Cornicularia normoerica]
MSEEHSPSYYAQQGAEFVGEEIWDLLGTNDFGSDLPFEDTYDFRAVSDLHKAEFTGSEAPDPKAYDIEHIQEVLRTAKEKKSSQNANYINGNELSRPSHVIASYPAQPPGDIGSTNSMPWKSTHSPAPATPSGLANGVGYSSFGDPHGILSDKNETVYCLTEGTYAGTDDAKYDDSDDSDEEAEESVGDEDIGDEHIPNQVASETYEENDPLIVQDRRQEKWGRTGMRNGQEVWFEPQTSKWQPSASHHDMREILIARAQAEYPNDRYRHPDKTDGLPHAETAFFKPHQDRGQRRNDCADALFVWREYKPKKDGSGKPIKKEKPKYIRKHPGFMYEGNRILLDPHNNPVVNHKFIPLTLSAQTEGSKLQEMALNPDCQQVDLWARMPRWEKGKDKKGNLVVRELRSKNTRINMPMTRFREKKGTIAGGDRLGTSVIIDGLKNFYHHHGFDPVTAGNSTKGFWRDLKQWEVNEVRLGNAAHFGARAGTRALDEKKREEKLQKLVKSIENGRNKDAVKNQGDAGKRPAQNHNGDVDDYDLAPHKRVYQRPGFLPGKSVKAKSGGILNQRRGKKASSSKTQRYGTYGAMPTPSRNSNPTDMHQQPQTEPYGTEQVFPNEQYFPQQVPRGGIEYEPVRIHGGYALPDTLGKKRQDVLNEAGHMSNNHYGPPVPRQESSEGTNGDPKRRGNTLGQGGRKMHLAAKQVLGKQLDVGEIDDTEDREKKEATKAGTSVTIAQNHDFESGSRAIANGTQHEQGNVETNSNPDLGSRQKRGRNNGTPGTEPKPQRRRRQNGKTPQPKRYGAGGAPEPLMPLDHFFGTTQPASDFSWDTVGPLMSPEEVRQKLGGIFDLDGSDHDNNGDAFNDTTCDLGGNAGNQYDYNTVHNRLTHDMGSDMYQPYAHEDPCDSETDAHPALPQMDIVPEFQEASQVEDAHLPQMHSDVDEKTRNATQASDFVDA